MTLDDLPELAKPKEVAAYLRTSVNHVYDACNRVENPMPSVKLGPHGLRVHRRALAVWLGVEAPVSRSDEAAEEVNPGGFKEATVEPGHAPVP